jgi:hypothetical protein
MRRIHHAVIFFAIAFKNEKFLSSKNIRQSEGRARDPLEKRDFKRSNGLKCRKERISREEK